MIIILVSDTSSTTVDCTGTGYSATALMCALAQNVGSLPAQYDDHSEAERAFQRRMAREARFRRADHLASFGSARDKVGRLMAEPVREWNHYRRLDGRRYGKRIVRRRNNRVR